MQFSNGENVLGAVVGVLSQGAYMCLSGWYVLIGYYFECKCNSFPETLEKDI